MSTTDITMAGTNDASRPRRPRRNKGPRGQGPATSQGAVRQSDKTAPLQRNTVVPATRHTGSKIMVSNLVCPPPPPFRRHRSVVVLEIILMLTYTLSCQPTDATEIQIKVRSTP